ncbi:hypothetical protein BCR42DRAFT_451154 [Absidia repens]|uniref:PH domain-containing protein n=1 Tax=Absidia repens TaxID=90262 RepID=A0A1X2IJ35_9FUNG|nr:hypothetical protein BCR42DRAFT_451154 [Absidia repens]
MATSLSHPSPRPSLSESALPSRRVLLRTNNTNMSTNASTTSSSMGLRPSRFVKPPSSFSSSTQSITPTSTTNNNNNNTNAIWNAELASFVCLFEEYSQKVYMEGYLMHQDKKYFVELCGTTLALWDSEHTGAVVTPTFIPIMVDTNAYPARSAAHHQQFTLELVHKKKSMVFDTLDPASMTKWICAIRLACFERQLLNQYFTLHLFTFFDSTTSTNGGYLQVLLPNNKNEWRKLWVVVTDSNSNSNSNGKKSKRLGTTSMQSNDASCPRLSLYESKKSKTPLLVMNRVDFAYAVYPESASLICQSTLMRLEGGVQQQQLEDHPSTPIVFMADSTNHMMQWLSSLYDTFKLYGRPQALVQDPMNPVALNFGEVLPETSKEQQHPSWWLDTDDVIQAMESSSSVSLNKLEIHQLLINTLCQKQTSLQSSQQSYSQQRANSLPLITVESMDPPRQRATSEAGILDEPSIRSALHSQVADSSDESDNDLDDDDDDEVDDEVDSDDEPIGKSKSVSSRQSSFSTGNKKNGVSSLLIPDFDFGNGFDTDNRRTSAASSILLSPSPISPNNSTQKQHQRQQHHRGHSSSTTTTSSGETNSNNNNNNNNNKASSSLFGDFSLTTDFNKYLEPTSRTSTPVDRKYSLPANVKLHSNSSSSSSMASPVNTASSHGSNGMNRRTSSWDDHGSWDDYIYQDGDDENEDDDDEDDDEDEDDDDDDDDDDGQDGFLIPSLNDHFAPRNSLLDTCHGGGDSHHPLQLSAKEQIEYARATGRPLIQVPSKPKPPKGGLVGVISQREKSRRQGKGARVVERVHQHHVDLLEREKERRIWEQRQQQYMKHQIMMYAQNGYVHPMMMHPYMAPPPPPPPPFCSSPSPMHPANTHGYFYNGRPYSPSGNSYHSTSSPSSSPHPPFINLAGASTSGSGSRSGSQSSSSGSGSVLGQPNSSRPLEDDDEEDEPLYSPMMVYQQQRTASPAFY